MSNSRVAARYAKPLLELADEKGILEAVSADMREFGSLCRSNKDFLSMLKSPVIPHLKKADILQKLFAKKVNELTLSAFNIITRKNRESILPEIAVEFGKLYNEKKGLQEATVTTTYPLDGETRKIFEKVIRDISGKTPLLTEKVDPKIIGGFVLMLGDRQIDESVSGLLRVLKLKFNKK